MSDATAMHARHAALVAALRAVVGAAHVLTDPDLTAPYAVDWTGRVRGTTPAVVRPADAAEIARVLQVCADAETAVVPQGGNTGLVAGGVPADGEVVLALGRLDALDPVDTAAMQVTVGAGATLAAVQRHAVAAGLVYPVDLAARESATIGGTVATNAGGIRVVRYGATRAQVVGLEAVTADGAIVRRLSGLVKDNAGYDLPGLLAGSEGTLAVITRVRLRLVPPQPCRTVALVALDGVAEALRVVAAVRASGVPLEAAEYVTDVGMDLVATACGVRSPFPTHPPAALLLEAASTVDPTDALAAAIAGCAEVVDVAVGTDAAARDRLWAVRERHTEAIATQGIAIKLDVSLPSAHLADFATQVPDVVRRVAPAARTILFGHLADGNLHVNVLDADAAGTAVDDAVLRLTTDLGGSISAEHGIGRAKLPWLHLHRDQTDIAVMRAVKRALDPDGLLNPHVLLPPR